MPLLALADDVLHNILSYCSVEETISRSGIKYDPRIETSSIPHTLCALCETCRYLNDAATPYLYRCIYLQPLHALGVNNITVSHQFKAFHQTIRDHAELGRLVHSLNLHWWFLESCPGVEQSIADVLSRLPHLRNLQMSSSHDRLWNPGCFDLIASQRLHTLRLCGAWATLELLPRWQTLKNLQVVLLDGTQPGPDVTPPAYALDHNLSLPNIRRLYLPAICMPLETLNKLVASLPSLTHLIIRYPGDMQPVARGIRTRELLENVLWGPLCPSELAHALNPVKESLEELHVTDHPHAATNALAYITKPADCALSHDGSQLDLSSFARLRKLQVPALCFFDTGLACDPRSSIFKVLPSQLENLGLYFGYTTALQLPIQSQAKPFKGVPTFSSEAYKWMFELASHKRQMFPYLHTLMIREKPVRRGHKLAQLHLWIPPLPVEEVLQSVSIKLDAAVRANQH